MGYSKNQNVHPPEGVPLRRVFFAAVGVYLLAVNRGIYHRCAHRFEMTEYRDISPDCTLVKNGGTSRAPSPYRRDGRLFVVCRGWRPDSPRSIRESTLQGEQMSVIAVGLEIIRSGNAQRTPHPSGDAQHLLLQEKALWAGRPACGIREVDSIPFREYRRCGADPK